MSRKRNGRHRRTSGPTSNVVKKIMWHTNNETNKHMKGNTRETMEDKEEEVEKDMHNERVRRI